MRAGRDYCANYCEENVWRLCGAKDLVPGPRSAVFVTSPARAVAIWEQRSAPPGAPVFWDYHVVLAVGGWVYDLDSRLPFPSPLEDYAARALAPALALEAAHRPRFRVIPGEDYLDGFSSDRSHMLRADGSYASPPPPWPAILPEAPRWPLARALSLDGLLELPGLLEALRGAATRATRA